MRRFNLRFCSVRLTPLMFGFLFMLAALASRAQATYDTAGRTKDTTAGKKSPTPSAKEKNLEVDKPASTGSPLPPPGGASKLLPEVVAVYRLGNA